MFTCDPPFHVGVAEVTFTRDPALRVGVAEVTLVTLRVQVCLAGESPEDLCRTRVVKVTLTIACISQSDLTGPGSQADQLRWRNPVLQSIRS